MKKAALITTGTILSLFSQAVATDDDALQIPWGSLSVDRAKVRSGEKANLSWEINYPLTLPEIITPKLETKVPTKVQAFMIGTAVSNHNTATITDVHLGDDWRTLYQGVGAETRFVRYERIRKTAKYRTPWGTRKYTYYVNVPIYEKVPNLDTKEPIFERVASTGTQLGFRSKLVGDKNFIYKGDKRVLILRNGDRPSSKEGWGGDASLEDYIAPYLKNGVLEIGEFDIMIAAELTHTWDERNDSGYDSNDSIALLRFIPVTDND